MESDGTSSPVDAISLMKEALPEYVVNCFLAAGYDTTEVITTMDISESPGNSIELIEKYISERYPKDPRYCNNPDSDLLLAKRFEFPPGHRIRICNFICALRKKVQGGNDLMISSRKRKQQTVSQTSCKRARTCSISCSTSSETEAEPTISSVLNQIRKNISKWVKKQPDLHLKNLQENKQFSIMVTHVAKEQNTFSSAIKCNACNVIIHLHQKDKSAKGNPYLISNWTRHVKTCKSLNSKQKSFCQSTISHFLSRQSDHDHASGTSTTESLLEDTTSDTSTQLSDISSEIGDEPYSNLTPPHFVTAPPPAI